MSEVNYAEMVDGYEKVPENYGQTNLVSGWYPFKIEKAEYGSSKNGVPMVHLQLSVTPDGPSMVRNKRAFVDVYLGAGKSKSKNDKDESGNPVRVEIRRTAEEFKEALSRAQAMAKKFMRSIGLTTNVPTVPSSDEGFIAQFYRVDEWPGSLFMGRLEVGNFTNLREVAPMNDNKRGLDRYVAESWGKAKTEAELIIAASSDPGSAVASTVEI